MTDTGFAVLCAADGVVITSYGESAFTAGAPLTMAVARDSRERLLQIMSDARGGEQHSIMQMADGSTLELHCAGDNGRILVVGAPAVAGVRSRCEALASDPVAGAMARRIAATSVPDELTLDLWSELARVNNELATAQRQLAKSNAELRWLNEQKNQLLGMAAHDLRNPLAAVIAYTGFVLQKSENLSSDQAAMMHRIEVNVEAMLGMVEDVLDFSAIESGTVRLDPSELALGELISDIAETNGLIAERKNIRIVSIAGAGLPRIVADRRKLAQVINNLVTNAIKFSHPGSSVTIAAGAGDGEVWISVTDRGLGMTPEQTARLFEPFARVGVQATAGEKSTGLGLAIVRRIVEAHRGHVEVESAPGQGTTFTVVLPAVGAAASDVAQSPDLARS